MESGAVKSGCCENWESQTQKHHPILESTYAPKMKYIIYNIYYSSNDAAINQVGNFKLIEHLERDGLQP